MAKVIYKSLKAKHGTGTVRKKIVISPNGKKKTILTVDANSPSFGEDLRIIFAENVKKANTEYKRVVGAAGSGHSKS
jgi:hypothetical protein